MISKQYLQPYMQPYFLKIDYVGGYDSKIVGLPDKHNYFLTISKPGGFTFREIEITNKYLKTNSALKLADNIITLSKIPYYFGFNDYFVLYFSESATKQLGLELISDLEKIVELRNNTIPETRMTLH